MKAANSDTTTFSLCRIMFRSAVISLFLVILLPLTAAFPESQEEARQKALKELREKNIPFTIEEFINRAGQGDISTVNLFLAAGMYYNVKDKDRWTALMRSAAEGHTGIVKLLLEKGADVNARNADGATALMLADAAGHSEAVNILLEYGAITYPGDRMETALIEATWKGNVESVKDLLAEGADPNAADEFGNAVLMYAVSEGFHDIAKVLLENGADANQKKPVTGMTALMIAVNEGFDDVAELLLDANADVNAKNRAQGTALMFAAAGGHADIVKLLLRKGANVNDKDAHGYTALMLAARNGYDGVIRALLHRGAVINLRNANGATAMMLAAAGGHGETVQLLRRAGARDYAGGDDEATESPTPSEDAAQGVPRLPDDEANLMGTDVEKLKEKIRRNACADNLRHIGLILSLFAAEQKDRFPRIDDVKGNLMFEAAMLYPEYLRDTSILGCPSDSGYREGVTFRLKDNIQHPDWQTGEIHPDCITCESYIYLGWLVTNEEEGLAAITAYRELSVEECDQSLIVHEGSNLSSNRIRRLSLGADRFLHSDVNAVVRGKPSPAAQVPVMWEWPTNHGNGGNVLYLDGHVEFVPYPGKFPMTKKFIKELRRIQPQFSEDVLPIITR